MPMQNKISVIIITGNEEKNIKDCLQSVFWADEIIVVDSESVDRTVEVAKEFTNKVYIHKWEGYAKQKVFALSLAKNEWILSLDADERVTKDLADEILSTDLSLFDGYFIRRENYFLDKVIKGCGWGSDYQLRLFKKNKARVTERLVHEKFITEGKITRLKNSIVHYSYTNLEDGFNKINKYSSLETKEKHNRKKSTSLGIILTPIIAFSQHYILRMGFRDGKHGLIVSLMHAITKLQVAMKIWEIKRKDSAI
jgi:glycosyltransferase involved in cell wall biosynthesis